VINYTAGRSAPLRATWTGSDASFQFESIWTQGRNMSSGYNVRRVVAALLWPADPIYRIWSAPATGPGNGGSSDWPYGSQPGPSRLSRR
jgi:hypothetical protein